MVALLACPFAHGSDVFNMPQGLTSLEFLMVGDPGNPADTEIMNDGTTGYGAVDRWFAIGKYEVTAGQYTVFLNAVAATDTYGLYSPYMWTGVGVNPACGIERSGQPGAYSYSVLPDWPNTPVIWVDWGDAARFANWLHNGQPTGAQNLTTTESGAYYLNGATTDSELAAVTREEGAEYFLPSEDEWYKAAYYDANANVYYDYPTGTDSTPSNSVVDPDPGNNANFGHPEPTVGGLVHHTTDAGEFENSVSPSGTFDQGGNVWELTEGQQHSPNYRGLRGGSWGYGYLGLFAGQRYPNDPTNDSPYIGFRIATIPEPATLSLLALGALALLRRRRR